MEEQTDKLILSALEYLFLNNHLVSESTVHPVLVSVVLKAFTAGKHYALTGLMTATDVAAHFGISNARARALIQNRHDRFGVGIKLGKRWVVHRDELEQLTPDERYKNG